MPRQLAPAELPVGALFPRSTRLLCDELLAEARARSVQLEQESLTLEVDLSCNDGNRPTGRYAPTPDH